MSSPQVYQAFVNGGFREVVLVKEAAPWLPCNTERVNTGVSGGGAWGLDAYKAHAAKLQNELNGVYARLQTAHIAQDLYLSQARRLAEELQESKRSGSLAQLDKLNERLHTAEFQRDKAVAANGQQAETLKMLMRDNETLHSNNRELESRVKNAHDYIDMLKRAANVAIDELGNVL